MRVLYLISLALSVASVFIHATTFLPGPVFTMNIIWPMHLAVVFLACSVIPFTMIESHRKAPDSLGGRNPVRSSGVATCSMRLMSCLSRLLPILLGMAFLYAILNFILFSGRMKDGSPAVVDGHYVLRSHGLITREISETEYGQYQNYEIRGVSGHWMLFSLFATMYFLSAWQQRLPPLRRDGIGEGT